MAIDSRILPDRFTEAYEGLTVTALNDGMSGAGKGMARDAELGKATGKQADGRRGDALKSEVTQQMERSSGPKPKQVGKTSATLKSEVALEMKIRIDKRLRRMAREIVLFLEDLDRPKQERKRGKEGVVVRVCSGRCRKFGDPEWLYCPHCGGPMRELSDDEMERVTA